MQVHVNEISCEIPDGLTLFGLRARLKPDADILILNGAPVAEDQALCPGDTVVLIRRGEVPAAAEMEALLCARHTPGVHDRVRRATVGIAGVGGLGSAVAIALARTGVGRLVVADFDVVEPSNLNRQQYFVDQIGMAKVDALRVNLARINPYVRVDVNKVRLDRFNLPGVFRDVQILVEAFDRADAKAMLMESFHAAFPDRPLVMASGLAGYDPAESIRVHRVGESVYVVGDLTRGAAPGTGLMAPRVGVAAHVQANAVLRLLLGLDPGAAVDRA